MIRILRRIDRNPFLRRKFGNGTEPQILRGIVLMGEHGGDFKSVLEQGFDPFASNVVVGKYDSFHSNSFGSRHFGTVSVYCFLPAMDSMKNCGRPRVFM